MAEKYAEMKAFEKKAAEKGLKYVGQPLLNRESEMKAAGEIQYIDDLRMPGMLQGKILFSPHAHAKIKSIDTSKAEALPGVRAVVAYKDAPRIIYNSAMRFYKDHSPFDMPKSEYIFDDTVRFVGDRVAAVAADDEFIASEALKLIEVEYELLPASITLEEAIKPGSPQVNPAGIEGTNVCGGTVAYGSHEEAEVLKAIEEADYTFEDTFHPSRVHHGYMEPVAHIASYTRDGKLTVWTSGQNVFSFRDVIAASLGMKLSKVRVIKTVCGGAFGGKLEVMHEPVAALLSMKTLKPVKIRLDRKETFMASRSRHEGILTIRSGVNKEGKIVAQHVSSALNTGAYAGSGPNTVGAQSGKMFILYGAEKMFYSGTSYFTNAPIAGAMRGYGCPQIMVTRETHTDNMARALGIDPAEFRRNNVILPHQNNCMGNNIHNARVRDCIDRGIEVFEWKNRRDSAEKQQAEGGPWRRGVGMDVAVHGNGWYPVYQDITTITIKMNNDGTATLLTGTHDLGTGSRTILSQIAAEILTIKPGDFEVIEADTDITPFDLGAQASRTTYIGGNATIMSARNLKEQLLEEAAAMLKTEKSNLDVEDGFVYLLSDEETRVSFEDIVASAQDGSAGLPMRELIATETFESLDSVDSYVAVFTDLEVNVETGETRVLDLLSVHNSGKVVNPNTFNGQVHGGMHMGLGYALSEDMKIDPETGKVGNAIFKKYKMFKAADMPEVRVETIEDPEEAGPFGAKSIGECSTDGIAGSVVNAVSHALGGVKLEKLPLEPDYLKEVIARTKN